MGINEDHLRRFEDGSDCFVDVGGCGGWRMEDGMIYVQGVAAILSFQDLLTALVHVLSSVHLRLGVLQLSLYLVRLMIFLSTNVLILF